MEGNTNHGVGTAIIVNHTGNDVVVQDKLKYLDSINRNFLQQSWANMAADEAAEHRLLKQLETDPGELQQPMNADDFQVVSRKKGKSKKSPLKSNYTTGAKASHPKPFK
jgi:hypothetical protein